MGQAGSKAAEARAQRRSQPKNSRAVQRQKLQAARATGLLALPDAKLRALPPELLDAPLAAQLRSLDLSRNRLDALPAEAAAFASLRTLKLAGNALRSLPDLSALAALSTLVLDGNAIEDLPNALPPNITKLSLRGNRLKHIPPSVLALPRLQELDLADNAITLLPSGIAQLDELQDLNVDGNALTQLPPALAKCGKLKVLSARGNRLSGTAKGEAQAIAPEVLRESGVHVMNLERNPMTKEDLQAMEGFDAFLVRRTKLKHKEVHGGLQSDFSICGLD